MRNLRKIFLMSVLLIGWNYAGNCESSRFCNSTETKEFFKIDGDMQKIEWENVVKWAPFTSATYVGSAPSEASRFMIRHNAEYLYIAVECDERKMESLLADKTFENAKDVWQDDCVEIFIDPLHDHKNYYHLMINSKGVAFLEKSDSLPDMEFKAAASRGNNRWVVEAAIPWKGLGVKPDDALLMGFNICRTRFAGNARECSFWAEVGMDYHNIKKFGHLTIKNLPCLKKTLAPYYKQLYHNAKAEVDLALRKDSTDIKLQGELDKLTAAAQAAFSEAENRKLASITDLEAFCGSLQIIIDGLNNLKEKASCPSGELFF